MKVAVILESVCNRRRMLHSLHLTSVLHRVLWCQTQMTDLVKMRFSAPLRCRKLANMPPGVLWGIVKNPEGHQYDTEQETFWSSHLLSYMAPSGYSTGSWFWRVNLKHKNGKGLHFLENLLTLINNRKPSWLLNLQKMWRRYFLEKLSFRVFHKENRKDALSHSIWCEGRFNLY